MVDRPLPSKPFYSIEYPGYVKPKSIPLAIHTLGGQTNLDNAFKRTASKTDTLLECKLRPDNPFAHPISGEVVSTNNLLLKVVKRKRKKVDGEESIGEYTAEVVGVIPKTGRFRSMLDYQYLPDTNDPLAKLRVAMENMDVDAIKNYAIPLEQEDYTVSMNDIPAELDPQLMQPSETEAGPSTIRSNLRMFPPPVFTRQNIPQSYNFKANTASMVSTVVDEDTGEEKKRLINRMRWKGYGPASIMYADATVPNKPPKTVENVRDQVNADLLKRLEEKFEERQVWTRVALYNQFSPADARETHNSKLFLSLVCYVFQDGPWRDTLVKLGYDPRQNVEARFFQRIYFRNVNHPISRPSVTARRQDGRSTANITGGKNKQSHIFNGVNITSETAAFQLCDIQDGMLKEMIEDEEDLRDVCNERDGWYSSDVFERIKTVLRHKFFSLLEGHVPTEGECLALLVPNPVTSKLPVARKRLKPGKHNMAKGALRPEDAAAVRLRAKLDIATKKLQSQRDGQSVDQMDEGEG